MRYGHATVLVNVIALGFATVGCGQGGSTNASDTQTNTFDRSNDKLYVDFPGVLDDGSHDLGALGCQPIDEGIRCPVATSTQVETLISNGKLIRLEPNLYDQLVGPIKIRGRPFHPGSVGDGPYDYLDQNDKPNPFGGGSAPYGREI